MKICLAVALALNMAAEKISSAKKKLRSGAFGRMLCAEGTIDVPLENMATGGYLSNTRANIGKRIFSFSQLPLNLVLG